MKFSESQITHVIDSIKKVLVSNGFNEDHNGNMVITKREYQSSTQYRFKFQNHQIMIQGRDGHSSWSKVESEYYENIRILPNGFSIKGSVFELQGKRKFEL